MNFKGKFKNLIFYEQETGLSLFAVETFDTKISKNDYNEVVCYGIVPNMKKGWAVEIEGEFKDGFKFNDEYEKDPFYGEILHVANMETKFIVSSIRTDYSLSFVKKEMGQLPGIGEHLATLVYNTGVFDRMNDLDNFIHEVMRITAMSKNAIVSLHQNMTYFDHIYRVFNSVKAYEISITQVERIYDKLGLSGINNLINSPYQICQKCGIPFLYADRIAADHGIKVYSRSRIKALGTEAVKRLFDEGHTYVTLGMCLDEINQIASAFNGIEIPKKLVSTDMFKIKGIELVRSHGVIKMFNKKRHILERNIAKQIKRLADSSEELGFQSKLIEAIAEETGMSYADQQRGAFKSLHSTGLKVITGGPGTGKTTTLNGILKGYEKICPEKTIKCCAPTGRAAQRMSESTGREAVTVHRLTEYKVFGEENSTSKNAEDPIDADCLVVDECSMLSIDLASVLLTAVKNGTLVLFMGDIDQLVSVGPGNVLKDIINSGMVEVYQLTDVFRQLADSSIIPNAQKINAGDISLVEANDFHIMRFDDAISMKNACMDLFKKLWNPDDKFGIQFLSPTNKGVCGVTELNVAAQKYVNGTSTNYFSSGKRKFFCNDKVILTNNNYELGYYNGDCGIISSFERGVGIDVDVCGNLFNINRKNTKDISLAYDITIHKSQGSEYPVVIIPIAKNAPKMLVRNLLYTAVTRAKKEVFILTEQDAMEISILTESVDKRLTTLKEEIIKSFS